MSFAAATAPKPVLGDKDVNAAFAVDAKDAGKEGKEGTKDIKSLEYHRQVLQSKMEAEGPKQYVSPSDNIMSPCTAKLKALRNKQVGKTKPKSLFAQASARKMADSSASNSSLGSSLGSSPVGRADE